MSTPVLKMSLRSVRSSLGRFTALLLIVFISVAFFAGLKVTTAAMLNTCGNYLEDRKFYDYRLISTLGFDADGVDGLRALEYVEYAETSKCCDVVAEVNGNGEAYKAISVPNEINLPVIFDGRMPEIGGECAVDRKAFEESKIGDVIVVPNYDGTLTAGEFEIVGFVETPLYMNLDRGTTTIGTGSLAGYFYITADSFAFDYHTDIYVTLKENAEIYSDEYSYMVESRYGEVTQIAAAAANARYLALLEKHGVNADTAELLGIYSPDVFVLTRNENAGYVSFESDSAIVGGIANIFPIFFILIAMLVCMTTMTRMIDEERGQIGVLKAMGFSNAGVLKKYVIYSLGATALGWVSGFFIGTKFIPQLFWYAYGAIYGFAPLEYMFSPFLALLTAAVSAVCIVGSSVYCCMRELSKQPAASIRPKPPKSGKRIFLEHITPLWNKFSFIQKVSFRNMFRYKPRFLMMLFGVGCCTALLVTAFGARDSMVCVGTLQYDEVQKYEMEVSFRAEDAEQVGNILASDEYIDSYTIGSLSNVEILNGEKAKRTSLMVFDGDARGFVDFRDGKESLSFPKENEIIICNRIASDLSVSVGDYITVRTADMKYATLTVSGIYDNYVNSYAAVSSTTYESVFGDWEANTAFVNCDDCDLVAQSLLAKGEITGVLKLSENREGIDEALKSIDYIVWVVVAFAGALAFVVIYNLTNVNLAERCREVATVEVLGFYPKEVYSYILRENMILSVIASLFGLPLGAVFHRLVMSCLNIDLITFPSFINAVSYIVSFVLSVAFAFGINQYMKRSINKIQMAESLKTVE